MRITAGLVPLLALLLAACSDSRTQVEAASAERPPEPPAIRVASAELRTLDRTIPVTGSLLPDETVSVSSEVAGRLAAVHFDFGQRARKGEIIAELDKSEFAIQHERARAALAQALARIGLNPGQEEVTPESTPAIRQARAQLEEARFKFDNAARLVKTGDISQERYIELEKAFRTREAAYEAARDELRTQLASILALRAEVRLAQKRLDDATVRAPFDGEIAARLVSPGQYLRENTPIVTLIKVHPLRLRLEIPESAAFEVRPGTRLVFTTDAAPGASFPAVVAQLNPALEARSRSLTAEARLTGAEPRLRPGMFVQVDLAAAREASAVMVPREALYQIAGLTKVFTVRDGRVVENRITPGMEANGWVEVPGDRIRPGDRVATSKLAMLVDGVEVNIEEAGR